MRFLIAFFISFVIYSQAYLFLFDEGYISVAPGIIFLVVILLGFLSWGMQLAGLGRARPEQRFALPERKAVNGFLIWSGLFFLSVSLSYLLSDADEFALRSWKTFLILIATTWAFHLATADKQMVKAAVYGVILALFVTVANNIIEIAKIGEIFTANKGRAAGFYVNPNIAGVMLNLGMVLSIAYIPPQHRLKFCLLIGFGVLLTFSRSGMLAWLLSTFLMSYWKFFKLNRYLALAVSLTFIVAVVLMQMGKLQLDANTVKELGSDAASRLVYSGDDSVEGRKNEAERAIGLYLEMPVFGHGLGSSKILNSNPHNTYLRLAVEQGIIGVMLFLVLIVLLLRRKNRVALVFGIVMAVLSLFTHNMLDYPGRWFALLLGFKVLDVMRQLPRSGRSRE